MNNYNINMKKFNGTDYDNLLPLAYNSLNSQQLDGKTFEEIQNLFELNYVKLYSRSYIGTGLHGQDNPTTITFPFQPSIVILPRQTLILSNSLDVSLIYISSELPTDFYLSSGITDSFYIKKSSDGKSITWYATAGNHGDASEFQFNIKDARYYFAGIGGFDQGGQTEWILTASQIWTVPRTGRYYLELYGGGGGANMYSDASNYGCTGGSSCQSYDSIQLTTNQQINVIIGKGGESTFSSGSNSGENTSFGNYTVSGGTRTSFLNQDSYSLGSGARNKGTSGQRVDNFNINPNTGTFRSIYRYGGCAYRGNLSDAVRVSNGGPRAVYLKYLGA